MYRNDAARVFLLALEQGAKEPVYHALGESGVAFRDIAEVIGRRLKLPVAQVEPEHFGWFARIAQAEASGSSEHTRAKLGWKPSGPGMLPDLDQPGYFAT